jgi:periplasmic protein TonB
MTSHEILQSSMLDILFENRNKQYGAYALRKFYANRMGVALAISLSSVLLLLFLFSLPSDSSSTNAALPDDKTIIVSTVDIPKEELPPPAKVEPPVAQPKAQVAYNNNIVVVPDNLVDEPLPTVDEIQSAVISNITTAGTLDGIPAATSSVGDGQPAAQPAPDVEPPIFDPIEKQPEYPGGVEAWRNFLSRYLQAPDELAAGERKTVQVRFMVSITGEVTNFEIVQSAGNSFDREVLRVMKKMPKWTPAIQNGHKIAVSFVQPVTFQGTEE